MGVCAQVHCMYHLKCKKLRELSDPSTERKKARSGVPIIACMHEPDISAQCDVMPIDIYGLV